MICQAFHCLSIISLEGKCFEFLKCVLKVKPKQKTKLFVLGGMANGGYLKLQ